MYIKEIYLDGFKSYAQRTVIANFDPSFNAITGLNGSGKSNILDAICFVLGISVLSQVRVSNLQELIYKQGQAGITKASVSILFNNEDRSDGACPVGYEQYKEITVTRQIVAGGRNKYLINGKAAQQSTVQSLFHSVQLNVNNPHFLIMQGRITKVINMKPAEVLGLMEEAAGTRMFEVKKSQALKTIEKKNNKLDEISRVIGEEIAPKLEKLDKERKAYDEYCNNQVAIEKLAKFVTAYIFMSNEELEERSGDKLEENEEQTKQCHQDIQDLENQIKTTETEMSTLKQKFADEMGPETAKAEKAEKDASKQVTQAKASLSTKEEQIKREVKNSNDIEEEIIQTKKTILGQQREREKLDKDYNKIKNEVEKVEQQITKSTSQLELLKSGVATNEEGVSLTEQLTQYREKMSKAKTLARQSELKLKHLQQEVKSKDKQIQQTSNDTDTLQQDYDRCTKELKKLKAELEKSNYDSAKDEEMQANLAAMKNETRDVIRQFDMLNAQLSSLHFQYADPWKNFDRSSVKGLVANLITVEDSKNSTAIEVTAGGKLWNVVVDSEQTGKALLQKGQLKRRVTIIPLNKISYRVADDTILAKARKLTKDNAVLALRLIGYEDDVDAAMKYIFGKTLVCTKPEHAKAVTFNNEIRMTSVTLEGDTYSPYGTLTGGASNNIGTTLKSLQKLNQLQSQVDSKKQQYEQLERQYQSMMNEKQKYLSIKNTADVKEAEMKHLNSRLKNTTHHQLVQDVADMKAEITNLESTLSDAKKDTKAAEEKCTELEAQMKNFKCGQSELNKVEADIKKHKKKLKDMSPQLAQKQEESDSIAQEIKELEQQVEELKGQLAEQQKVVNNMKEETSDLKKALKEKQKVHETAQNQLKKLKAKAAHMDTEVQALEDAIANMNTRIGDANLSVKKLEHERKNLASQASRCQASNTRILKDNPWISHCKERFGVQGSEFDFSARDPKKAEAELEGLKESQKLNQKSINKRVIAMFETVQQEFQDLQIKRKQVEKDKETIEAVIVELDRKKKQQLKETHHRVNKDFGDIFHTLLPGANAELSPCYDRVPDQTTNKDDLTLLGLEVRVGFNGKWKESLAELSGGQRSLMALSLILALLRFKPAPMYILDEVDAALDVSHTQNIGRLLKKYFNNSQFIVVSLKEGMFNNANVIFRTKFVNGHSTVTRTENRT